MFNRLYLFIPNFYSPVYQIHLLIAKSDLTNYLLHLIALIRIKFIILTILWFVRNLLIDLPIKLSYFLFILIHSIRFTFPIIIYHISF